MTHGQRASVIRSTREKEPSNGRQDRRLTRKITTELKSRPIDRIELVQAQQYFIPVVAVDSQILGANGQGRDKEEARESIAQAIALILADHREDGLRGGASGRRARDGNREVKRSSLLQHLRRHGCSLKREGSAHSLWTRPPAP